MIRIRLAKTAGFCMGVRRAVDTALDLQRIGPPRPIVTYGPLIHNPPTLELLRSRGIGEASSLDEIEEGTVVIRAHGISPAEREALEEKGVTIIDATCPRVAAVQAIIKKHARKGDFCVVVGDEDHPEVKGLMGFASAGGLAVSGPEDMEKIERIPRDAHLCVTAQTTQEVSNFDRTVELLRERGHTLSVFNTVCNSTKKRQEEAKRLSRHVDAVVVVGGKGSGNTQRLAKVARDQGVDVLHVERAEEITSDALSRARAVGVTAGASTPNWQIQRVIHRLKEIGMSRPGGLLKSLRKVMDAAIMTYAWAAIGGGGGLAVACLSLQGKEVRPAPLLTAILFLLTMHLFNRLHERMGAVRFNTPEAAAFYADHRYVLWGLGIGSAAGACALSWTQGLFPCALVTVMMVAGVAYTLSLGQSWWPASSRRRSIKEITGTKTPLVAAGWGVATAVVPAAPVIGEVGIESPGGLAIAFVFAAGMVFWRTALSDLVDIQGDRIVGRETIPILIGADATRKVLIGLLFGLAVLLVGGSAARLTASVGYVLTANVAAFGLFLLIHRMRQPVDRVSLDGLLDGNLFLAGAISVVYGMM